ncbi:MAG TPA: hypothetical protein HPP94_08695 [Desulfuromonadales bacterium]|nr:hypothetical protein [Desulfuromonadales bacterium]
MKNWKTSLAGALGGLPQIITGIVNNDWAAAGSGITLLLVGLLAKDHDVTGGTVVQSALQGC